MGVTYSDLMTLRRRLPAAACTLALLLVVMAAPAAGHGDEPEPTGRDQVLQAIALIVNEPSSVEAALERLRGAREAEDRTGVDLALVQRGGRALAAGDPARAKDLLQQSIGARTDLSGADVRHILQVPRGAAYVPLATREQSGTVVVTEELPGRDDLGAVDLALLGVAAAVAALGIVLGIRLRPAHSVHALRHSHTVEGG